MHGASNACVSGLLKEQRCDRTVDAAAHGNKYFFHINTLTVYSSQTELGAAQTEQSDKEQVQFSFSGAEPIEAGT